MKRRRDGAVFTSGVCAGKRFIWCKLAAQSRWRDQSQISSSLSPQSAATATPRRALLQRRWPTFNTVPERILCGGCRSRYASCGVHATSRSADREKQQPIVKNVARTATDVNTGVITHVRAHEKKPCFDFNYATREIKVYKRFIL